MSREGINVCVRVRPYIQREIDNHETDCKDWVIKSNSIHHQPKNKIMTFDRVFYHVHNRTVYEDCAKRIVESALEDGLNGSIFAYGQTSSGKTFTMSSVMEYSFLDMWEKIQGDQSRTYQVAISYCEVYNEQVIDLLDQTKTNLSINASTGEVLGLTKKDCLSASEMLLLQFDGAKNRKVGATKMNTNSSRSHSIFQVYIKSTPNASVNSQTSSPNTQVQEVRSGTLSTAAERIGTLNAQLNFVDLAGSERANQTQATGDRLQEGAQINKSLLTLGKVIRALSSRNKHELPSYRESKLTLILRHSLGGNCRTAIICCITLSTANYNETQSTLLFAEGAKNVVNTVCRNEELDDKQLFFRLSEQYNHIRAKFGEVLHQIKSQINNPSSFTVDLSSYELIAQQHGIGPNGDLVASAASSFRPNQPQIKLPLTTHVSSFARSTTVPQAPFQSALPQTPLKNDATTLSSRSPHRSQTFLQNPAPCSTLKKRRVGGTFLDPLASTLTTPRKGADFTQLQPHQLVELNDLSFNFEITPHTSQTHINTSISTELSILSLQYQSQTQQHTEGSSSPSGKRKPPEQLTSVQALDARHHGFSSSLQHENELGFVKPVQFFPIPIELTPNPIAVFSKLGLSKYGNSNGLNSDQGNITVDLDKLSTDLETLLGANGVKTDGHYRNQISTLTANLTLLQGQYDELLETYNTILDEHRTALKRSEQNRVQIESYDEILKKAQNDYIELQSERDQVSHQLRLSEAEKQSLQAEKAQLMCQIEVATATYTADIESYEMRLTMQRDDCTPQYKDLVGQLQQQLRTQQAEKQQLQSQLERLKEDHVEEIADYKEEVNETINQMQLQVERTRQSHQDDREQLVKKYQASMLQCEETIDGLEEEMLVLEKEKKELTQNVNDLEGEIVEIKLNFQTVEGKLQTKLSTTDQAIAKQNAMIQELNEKLAQSLDKMNTHQQELNTLREQATTQTNTIQQQVLQLQDSDFKFRTLSHKHQVLEEQYQKDKSLTNQLNSELKTANQTIQELNKNVAIMSQSLSKTTTIQTSDDIMFDFDHVIQSDSSMINSLEHTTQPIGPMTIRSLLSTISPPRTNQGVLQQYEQLKSLQNHYKGLKDDLAELQSEHKQLIRDNKHFRKNIATLEDDNQQLVQKEQHQSKKLSQQSELLHRYETELQTYSITSSISASRRGSPSVLSDGMSSSSFLSPTLNLSKSLPSSLSATLLPSHHSGRNDVHLNKQQVDMIKVRYETELDQKQSILTKKQKKYNDLKAQYKELSQKYQLLLEQPQYQQHQRQHQRQHQQQHLQGYQPTLNNTMNLQNPAHKSFLVQPPRTRNQAKLLSQQHQQFHNRSLAGSSDESKDDFFLSTANLDQLLQEQFQTSQFNKAISPTTSASNTDKIDNKDHNKTNSIDLDDDVAELLDIFNSTQSLQTTQFDKPTTSHASRQTLSNANAYKSTTDALSAVAAKTSRPLFDLASSSQPLPTRASPLRRILPQRLHHANTQSSLNQTPSKLTMMTTSVNGIPSKQPLQTTTSFHNENTTSFTNNITSALSRPRTRSSFAGNKFPSRPL